MELPFDGLDKVDVPEEDLFTVAQKTAAFTNDLFNSSKPKTVGEKRLANEAIGKYQESNKRYQQAKNLDTSQHSSYPAMQSSMLNYYDNSMQDARTRFVKDIHNLRESEKAWPSVLRIQDYKPDQSHKMFTIPRSYDDKEVYTALRSAREGPLFGTEADLQQLVNHKAISPEEAEFEKRLADYRKAVRSIDTVLPDSIKENNSEEAIQYFHDMDGIFPTYGERSEKHTKLLDLLNERSQLIHVQAGFAKDVKGGDASKEFLQAQQYLYPLWRRGLDTEINDIYAEKNEEWNKRGRTDESVAAYEAAQKAVPEAKRVEQKLANPNLVATPLFQPFLDAIPENDPDRRKKATLAHAAAVAALDAAGIPHFPLANQGIQSEKKIEDDAIAFYKKTEGFKADEARAVHRLPKEKQAAKIKEIVERKLAEEPGYDLMRDTLDKRNAKRDGKTNVAPTVHMAAISDWAKYHNPDPTQRHEFLFPAYIPAADIPKYNNDVTRWYDERDDAVKGIFHKSGYRNAYPNRATKPGKITLDHYIFKGAKLIPKK